MSNHPIMKVLQEELERHRDEVAEKRVDGLTNREYISNSQYHFRIGHNVATARLLGLLTKAVEVIEKYEPYCVPMWVDSEVPEYKTIKEVWLAREFLTTLADIKEDSK